MATIWERKKSGKIVTTRTGFDAAYFKFGSALEKIKSTARKAITLPARVADHYIEIDKRHQKAQKDKMREFIRKSKDPSNFGRRRY